MHGIFASARERIFFSSIYIGFDFDPPNSPDPQAFTLACARQRMALTGQNRDVGPDVGALNTTSLT